MQFILARTLLKVNCFAKNLIKMLIETVKYHSITVTIYFLETRDRRLTINAQQVAFHVVADASQSHLDQGQNIVFDTVLLNVGDSYHDQHGVFIAPVPGIYVFSVTVMNQAVTGHEFIEAALYKDGTLLEKAMADGRTSGYDQGSFTVTTQLQEGSEVWVECYYPKTDDYLYGARFSSFTGFLLAAS